MQDKATKNKSGIGVGSASIVLIFAVLCLTVFTLITYIAAGNYKNLVDAERDLVTGYYEADALAERVLLELTAAAQGDIIETASGDPFGADVSFEYYEHGGIMAYFYCPINEVKSLYVSAVIRHGSCSVLSWRMVDTDEWEPDGSINVWDGE